jgi:hypothetical protein
MSSSANQLFIDPTGHTTYGIGLCARCSRKFSLDELKPDPNYPNLMVCSDDSDVYDPYRLAPRGEDRIALPFTRPDVKINTRPAGLIQEQGDQFIITEDGQGYLIP